MPDLTSARTLLALARAAIGARARLRDVRGIVCASRARRSRARRFVTLTQDGELRGCIGSLEARRPLGADVARQRGRRRIPRSALSAARRARVRARSRSRSRCCPRTSRSRSPTRSDLLRPLRPGDRRRRPRSAARHRATFLPQVWETLPEPRAVPRRAEATRPGCAPDFWSPSVNVLALHGRPSGAEREFATRCERAMSNHPGRWWHALDDGRIQCDLCPRDCRLHEGQRGACFVRQRDGDAMVLTTYGRSSGFCIDPIEKKPLNHFYPGLERAVVRHRRLQPRLQVLPELGHLEVARDGPADGRGVARGDRRGGRERAAARASPSPTTTR